MCCCSRKIRRELFEFAAAAFDLAERLQTPIFVLEDLDIGMNEWLCEPFTWDDSRIYDRGKMMTRRGAGSRQGLSAAIWMWMATPFPTAPCPAPIPPRAPIFTRGTSRDRYAKYSEEGAVYQDNMQRLLRKFETAKSLVPAPGDHAGQGKNPLSA